MTAAEAAAQLEQDPAYLAMREEQEDRLREFDALLDKDEQPLIEALRAAGVAVNSVWDLVNTRTQYPKAIPLLVEHLRRPYHPRTKEGIARALTVKTAKPIAWEALVQEFKRTKPDTDISEATRRGLKFALANALAYISDRTVLDDVLELVQDQRHGEDRFVLVGTLWRYSDERVIAALQNLVKDKDAPVARDAATALGRIQKRTAKAVGNPDGKRTR